jgi:AraC-like DNA-binding protein
LVLTPPGEVHENWVTKDSGCSFRGVYLEVELLRRAANHITGRDAPPEFSLMVFQDAMVKESLTRLHHAFELPELLLRREELLLELAGLLVTAYSKTTRPKNNVGCERQAVRMARSFIDEHFAGSISLEELGRLTNLSPFHLHRVFRRQTGMPPHAYQTQVRVNRAKQLLLRGWPLAEVALATGFADQSHLTRHFRRLVGVTPGRYPC